MLGKLDAATCPKLRCLRDLARFPFLGTVDLLYGQELWQLCVCSVLHADIAYSRPHYDRFRHSGSKLKPYTFRYVEIFDITLTDL